MFNAVCFHWHVPFFQGPFPGLPPGLDFLKNHVRFQQQQQVKVNNCFAPKIRNLTFCPMHYFLVTFKKPLIFRHRLLRIPPSPASALECRCKHYFLIILSVINNTNFCMRIWMKNVIIENMNMILWWSVEYAWNMNVNEIRVSEEIWESDYNCQVQPVSKYEQKPGKEEEGGEF